MQEIILEMAYFERRLSKMLWKCNFIFMEFVMRSKNAQEPITSPFSGFQICSKVLILWSIFGSLIESDFGVFSQKLQLIIYTSPFIMT